MKGRVAGWTAIIVALSTLAYVSHFETKPENDVAYRWSASVSGLIFYGLLLILIAVLTRGLDRRSFLAFRRPSSWGRAAGIATLIVIATFVIGALVAPFGDPEKEQGLIPEHWDSHRIAQFAAFAFVITVVGPITEELLFRGTGYGLLVQFGPNAAVVLVGLAFALIHGLVAGFPVIAAFGIGTTYLRSRTDSIYPCIALHMCFNGLGLALGVAT